MLLFNPNAGRFPPEIAAKRAAARLTDLGWSVKTIPTRSAGHITALAEEAAGNRDDALIIAGGDGSIGRAVAGLSGSRTALAVLPTGTANVWAKELGLPPISPSSPRGIEANADLIAAGTVKKIDTGRCNGTPSSYGPGSGWTPGSSRNRKGNGAG